MGSFKSTDDFSWEENEVQEVATTRRARGRVQTPLLLLLAVILNRNVISGLAYLHTVTLNSFGCRGHHPPPATCVSTTTRTTL